jgi:hypothetical protein
MSGSILPVTNHVLSLIRHYEFVNLCQFTQAYLVSVIENMYIPSGNQEKGEPSKSQEANFWVRLYSQLLILISI